MQRQDRVVRCGRSGRAAQQLSLPYRAPLMLIGSSSSGGQRSALGTAMTYAEMDRPTTRAP